MQILGDPEVGYIQSSSKDEIYENIKRMFTYSIPCLFFCMATPFPSSSLLANESNIPIIQSALHFCNINQKMNEIFCRSHHQNLYGHLRRRRFDHRQKRGVRMVRNRKITALVWTTPPASPNFPTTPEENLWSLDDRDVGSSLPFAFAKK